jgi:membrane protein YqaA with SNARE-associated domain
MHTNKAAIRVSVRGLVSARAYPVIIGALAVATTVTMVPLFTPALVLAVLVRRDRWVEIVVWSSLGSATGGLVLYLIFHYFGWSQIVMLYPGLMQSKAWTDTTRWVSSYGTSALFVMAVIPFPQTPAFIFTAVSRLPISEVFVAVFVGKLLKYGVYGFVSVKCPSWVRLFVTVRHRSIKLLDKLRLGS